MPVRVQQRGIDLAPVARVVDQQHRGDGETAEGVEAEQVSGSSASSRPKPSGMRSSAVITKLGMVASNTQAKKGT